MSTVDVELAVGLTDNTWVNVTVKVTPQELDQNIVNEPFWFTKVSRSYVGGEISFVHVLFVPPDDETD